MFFVYTQNKMMTDVFTTSENISNFFLAKAKKEGVVLTNKKLQKLLYYAQAWTLANFSKALFDDEIQAWIYGPVVPTIYHKYKSFGWSNITKSEEFDCKEINEVSSLLEEVWGFYGSKDSDYLVSLSHSEKPWQEARANLDDGIPSVTKISKESMRDYYLSLKNND